MNKFLIRESGRNNNFRNDCLAIFFQNFPSLHISHYYELVKELIITKNISSPFQFNILVVLHMTDNQQINVAY